MIMKEQCSHINILYVTGEDRGSTQIHIVYSRDFNTADSDGVTMSVAVATSSSPQNSIMFLMR